MVDTYNGELTSEQKETISEAQRLVSKQPDNVLLRVQLGELLFRVKKFEEAIRVLSKAADMIERGPKIQSIEELSTSRVCLAILGDCHFRLGDMEKAQRWLKKSLEYSRSYANTWALYGLTYANSQDFLTAAEPIRTAVMLEPANQYYWKLLHDIYAHSNREETPLIGRLIEKNLLDQDNKMVIADLCMSAADYTNAQIALIGQDPKKLEVIQYMGKLNLLQQKYEQAIKILKPLFSKNSKNMEIALLLARTYLFSGKVKNAEKCLNKVLKKASKESEDSQKLAMIADMFKKTIADLERSPTTRFGIFWYDKDEDQFMYNADVIIPSGTTIEDFLHWIRNPTTYDEIFPPKDIHSLTFVEDHKMYNVQPGIRPDALLKYEPSALRLVWQTQTIITKEQPGYNWYEPIQDGVIAVLLPANEFGKKDSPGMDPFVTRYGTQLIGLINQSEMEDERILRQKYVAKRTGTKQ